jgi:hypothetical protein
VRRRRREEKARALGRELFLQVAQIDDEYLDALLSCAVYLRAARRGISPRTVIDELFQICPDDNEWTALRPGVEALLRDGR